MPTRRRAGQTRTSRLGCLRATHTARQYCASFLSVCGGRRQHLSSTSHQPHSQSVCSAIGNRTDGVGGGGGEFIDTAASLKNASYCWALREACLYNTSPRCFHNRRTDSPATPFSGGPSIQSETPTGPRGESPFTRLTKHASRRPSEAAHSVPDFTPTTPMHKIVARLKSPENT